MQSADVNKKVVHITPTSEDLPLVMGIVSSAEEYRLIGSINRNMGFSFRKIQIPAAKFASDATPPYIYLFEPAEGHLVYRLIPVRYMNKALPGKYHKLDYFLTITGKSAMLNHTSLLVQFRQINEITAAFKPERVSKAVLKMLA